MQEDVREVSAGYECGLTLDNYSDFRDNDRIEVFEEVEVARKLSAPA
jgi:translation initiation factor IF-2